MGRKKSRTSKISKGERPSVNQKIANGARKMRDEAQPFRQILDQQRLHDTTQTPSLRRINQNEINVRIRISTFKKARKEKTRYFPTKRN